MGTLGVAGYQGAIESIRRLAKQAGKKTYTMLMGKPNPAKLANFPEVEVFVMVADPQGMILDSKEYYAPIITPYEAHMAFSGDAEWTGDYSLDFSSLQVRRRFYSNACCCVCFVFGMKEACSSGYYGDCLCGCVKLHEVGFELMSHS